ncbi:MAG TPA: amino acid adenylation domain-containing protein, partial [Pseudonocardiaceae bacterium]|nr:amino acid adenylation domain-containing protein [Pseudonocardiaceae bacterium]
RLRYGNLGLGTSRFDIAINAFDEPDGFRLRIEYATDLFDRSTIERMFDHFARILAAGVTDPTHTLSGVPMLSSSELDQVLREWQGVTRPYPRELIHVQVAAQAARTPDATALVYEGDSISYRDLDDRAGLLARYLRECGLQPGESVGIGLERDIDMVVGVLAVLKAGGAFVPLDIEDPDLRRVFVLDDTETRFVLSRSALPAPIPAGDRRQVIEVDRIWPDAEKLADVPLPEWSTLDSAAYVLYTSGSTGRPKGVVIEHHALATYMDFLGNVFSFGPGDRMLLLSALVFDLAEGELFVGLSRGVTMVMIPRETALSPPELSEVLRRERVSYLGGPPAMIALLDPEPYPDLRGLLVGGEAFTGDLVNRWNLPGRLFLNAYGPTEATIGCTYYPCEHKVWQSSPPIGRAMPHRRVYLLDRWGVPVPIGVPGEIVSAGPGLARGYVHDDVLTAKKFVPDPFVPGERMYRTGDLAVWTQDGQIQFLGRIDAQVKLRGMRIEPGEIEAMIEAQPGVDHAVVVLREDSPGDPKLIAYVVAQQEAIASLRKELGRRLPLYMVPAAFVPMDDLPLTPTGKVDRPALPAPDLASRAQRWVAARTDTERTVAAIFADVLVADRVGAMDSFFDLGGNSLQAARVVARIRQSLDIQLRVRDFFDMPVVADLAAELDRTAERDTDDGTLNDEIAELERQLAEARGRLTDQG